MNIHFTSENLAGARQRCLVLLAQRDGRILNGQPSFSAALQPFIESGEFGKNEGDHLYLIQPRGFELERLLFVNLGERVSKSDDLRCAAAEAWKILADKRQTEAMVSLDGLDDESARAVVEGFILGDYKYTDLKTEKDKLSTRLENLTVHTTRPGGEEAVRRWYTICRGTCRARDLSQMPANILDPQKFASLALEWGATFGFKTEVMEARAIKDLGMGAMYSVGQGSQKPSKFIIMEYTPAKPSGKTFALVGKAVTFDSGGLSLKPPSSMPEMKGDMGGGAAVMGVMTVLRDCQCPHRVVGLVPAVENMPSGSATRPSDVVTTLSGLTVEINNTDAEGRLILIDALTFAARYKPDYVVDYATLTGACLVALGTKVHGVMGNHQPLVDAILAAGREVHEVFWQLPLVDDYKTLLKSEVADISNISSSRWGGTITAGLFLERFAEDYRWAHCDIAATIFEEKEDYHPQGGNGTGVRMTMRMMELLEGWSGDPV